MNKFYVVGIGPGAFEQMTIKAKDILESVDIIAGYNAYIDLVKPYFPDKEYLGNGMTGEIKRCKAALERAKEGKKRGDDQQRRLRHLWHGRSDFGVEPGLGS